MNDLIDMIDAGKDQAIDILDAMGDALFYVDNESRVTFANKETCRLLDTDFNEFIGKNISELISERGGWMFYRYLGMARSEKRYVKFDNFEYSGKLFEVYFYPARNGVAIFLHDITLKWHTDELYRLALFLLDKLNEIVFLVRFDGRLFHANYEAIRLLGFTLDELIHMKIFDIEYGLTTEGWPEKFNSIKKQKQSVFESEYKAKNGMLIPVEVSANYIKLYGNEYYCIAARDITKRRLVEIELQKSKTLVEMYNDLLGHDINNMNQIGMGYLELVLESAEVSEENKKLLKNTMDSLLNSSKLIENVKKLQRIKLGDFRHEKMDVNLVLLDVKNAYSNVSDRDIVINYSPMPGCMVMANELLRDAFSNLVGNAIKHSTGTLEINMGVSRVSENGREYFRAFVEDDGPGIQDNMKNKLFSRFQRGDTKTSGKGLGLYLVKMLIEDYGGRVWIEDRVKGDHAKGARFIVMLPVGVSEHD
jgi:PAS domain S-box-containing protein